jgi:DNA (cytosine-5)-methyltransferase 1
VVIEILDLYSGKGGAAKGYKRAGFRVIGVDINYHEDYAGDDFIQGDACKILRRDGHKFKFIHASPPCQFSSTLTKGTNQGRIYPNLIGPTREALQEVGSLWVIENVPGAQIRKDLMLCGEMFNLRVVRHRNFEFWTPLTISKVHPKHRGSIAGYNHGEFNEDGYYFQVYGEGGGKGTIEEWRMAMGIDWTWDRKGIAEAIPPAYTEWIGQQVMMGLVA